MGATTTFRLLAATGVCLFLAGCAANQTAGVVPVAFIGEPEGYSKTEHSAWSYEIAYMAPANVGPVSPPEKAPRPAAPPVIPRSHVLDGIASYYWQDQMTASGERFNKRAMTAAHKTLPLGTRVRVTHLGNGRSVEVRINDRGPFKAGRVIDLSEAAAEQIGMKKQGLAAVKVEVLKR